MPRLLAGALAAGFAFAAQAAPELRLADAGALTPAQAAATRGLLDEAVRRLPPRWAAALDRPIEVEWRTDLPAQVHGRARARRMLLRRALLQDWMDARAAATTMPAATGAAAGHDAAGHDTAGYGAAGPGMTDPARAALAAVLHELAHFYDRTPQGRLSRDPRLLDLAGWQVSPVRLGLRTGRNGFVDRSPDRYELAAPAEFVAVNLEHFLLDPEYACRRPALHAYFAAHFGAAPPAAGCAPGLVYLEAPQRIAAGPVAKEAEGTRGSASSALLQLDPGRVHAVDYLFAEGNRRPMSRWGHSMLRLVVCAPGRPRGPDCRLDLQYHRVLSFRAFVDDVQISSWRGLTGSYPSRLFVLPLEQVVEEYAKVELRGLQSLPLRLERAEIAALLGRAAQLHWSYDGRYYFLGNNCAVETFKLLHDGVPRLAGARLSGITPTGLLRRLRRAGLVDASVLDDRAEAMRLGYYFEPLSDRYQAMLDAARRTLDLPETQAEAWLDLPPARRTAWLDRADLRAGAALLLLEQAALRRQELQVRDELKRYFLAGRRGHGGERAMQASGVASAPSPSPSPSAPALRSRPASAPGSTPASPDPAARLRDLLQLEGYFSRPAALLPETGYGLPQQDEREALAREGARRAAQWTEQRAALQVAARRWLSPQRREWLETTEANLDRLGARLRRLHQAEGGLQLPRDLRAE